MKSVHIWFLLLYKNNITHCCAGCQCPGQFFFYILQQCCNFKTRCQVKIGFTLLKWIWRPPPSIVFCTCTFTGLTNLYRASSDQRFIQTAQSLLWKCVVLHTTSTLFIFMQVPKSASFKWPALSSNMLSGFTSLRQKLSQNTHRKTSYFQHLKQVGSPVETMYERDLWMKPMEWMQSSASTTSAV